VVDGGLSRASWIPTSHNIPLFAGGIAGPDILARQRATAEQYGARIVSGNVTELRKLPDGFAVSVDHGRGESREIRARQSPCCRSASRRFESDSIADAANLDRCCFEFPARSTSTLEALTTATPFALPRQF
jgi:hypothetical protein